MAMGDLPAMQSAQYASTAYGLGNLTAGNNLAGTAVAMPFQGLHQGVQGVGGGWVNETADDMWRALKAKDEVRVRRILVGEGQHIPNQAALQQKETAVARRLVQVFIADPDENIPLDDSLLYRGDQHLTDATDQELFFEIDIQSILKSHNAKRVKLINKKVKERVEHLEPAKIRDLKMIVVTVAQF
jgi:hypothetical protein